MSYHICLFEFFFHMKNVYFILQILRFQKLMQIRGARARKSHEFVMDNQVSKSIVCAVRKRKMIINTLHQAYEKHIL